MSPSSAFSALNLSRCSTSRYREYLKCHPTKRHQISYFDQVIIWTVAELRKNNAVAHVLILKRSTCIWSWRQSVLQKLFYLRLSLLSLTIYNSTSQEGARAQKTLKSKRHIREAWVGTRRQIEKGANTETTHHQIPQTLIVTADGLHHG